MAQSKFSNLSKEELLERLDRLEDWVDSWSAYFISPGDMEDEFFEIFPEFNQKRIGMPQ